MLKPYFEINSQVKTHLVNAVSLHPRKENDVREHSSLSDTSKLKNSDILKNLDSKLTHYLPSQCQDLKGLFTTSNICFWMFWQELISHWRCYTCETTSLSTQSYETESLARQDYLLNNDFIKPSQSNSSSPCILVPKAWWNLPYVYRLPES